MSEVISNWNRPIGLIRKREKKATKVLYMVMIGITSEVTHNVYHTGAQYSGKCFSQ
jgi:hypothetical protein